MPLIMWDASALVKRYFSEAGAITVDAVFDDVSSRVSVSTPVAKQENPYRQQST